MGGDLEYLPEQPVVLIVGNYGSGKTEVAVNLAIRLSEQHKVSIADLDIVNPYFRCREAREEMESFGIRVINPGGITSRPTCRSSCPRFGVRFRVGRGFRSSTLVVMTWVPGCSARWPM